eukprot:5343856-Alexandrium_andersonii.AAC.1
MPTDQQPTFGQWPPACAVVAAAVVAAANPTSHAKARPQAFRLPSTCINVCAANMRALPVHELHAHVPEDQCFPHPRRGGPASVGWAGGSGAGLEEEGAGHRSEARCAAVFAARRAIDRGA